jgi:hypothetical protein
MLEAHPAPALLVSAGFRVVGANAAARRLVGGRAGASLEEVLACVEARASGPCGNASCGGCAFRRAVERALAGERARARGFVLRGGARRQPDLHLIGLAGPFRHAGARHAILALDDANAMVADPGIVRVCEGCGRVQDEEGHWHALHRYLEDRLGLEGGGPLCDACDPGGAARR